MAENEQELDFEFALPDESAVDQFTSGDDEVDDYFHSRRWFNEEDGKSSPPTYKFCDENRVIGFAAVAFRETPHLTDDSPEKEEYLVIYVVGVSKDLHGVENPNVEGESYAVTLFRTLERFARQKEGVVGLSL